MTCKCGEIRGLEKELQKLNTAKSYLSSYNTHSASFGMEINITCNSIDAALYVDHADEIKSNFRKKAELFSPISTSLDGKISAKITEISEELSSLREKDTAYHEEERKRLENTGSTP